MRQWQIPNFPGVLLAFGTPHGVDGSGSLEMFPGRDVALRVQSAGKMMIRSGAIETMLHVVFARPKNHHRLACKLSPPALLPLRSPLGSACRTHHPSGLCGRSTFSQRQFCNAGNNFLRPLRRLCWHPRFRAVRPDMHGAIHWLHGGVRRKREFIDGFDFLGGISKRSADVALVAHHLAGFRSIVQKLLGGAKQRIPMRTRPSSQEICSALRPCMAAHELSARTTIRPR